MGVAVAAAITAVLPWVLAWFALGGNAESVRKNIEGFGAAVTSGPVNTATNAYIKIVFVVAGAGLGIWLLESEIAEKKGYDVAPPPIESIHVPAPPTFGSSGGYTANAGPVGVHAGVTSQGGGSSGSSTAGPAPTRKVRPVAKPAPTRPRTGAFTG